MGTKLNAQLNAHSPYVQAIIDVTEVITYRSTRFWSWIDFIFDNFFQMGKLFRRSLDILHGFTDKVSVISYLRTWQQQTFFIEYKTDRWSSIACTSTLLLQLPFDQMSDRIGTAESVGIFGITVLKPIHLTLKGDKRLRKAEFESKRKWRHQPSEHETSQGSHGLPGRIEKGRSHHSSRSPPTSWHLHVWSWFSCSINLTILDR